MLYRLDYPSPLGELTLLSSEEALLCAAFPDGKHYAAALQAAAVPEEAAAWGHPILEETRRWLDLYFSGAVPVFLPPLEARGSAFQLRVWELLKQIPYGRRVSYGAIAKALGTSPRAVGSAVGRNPISLLLPCHRVLGAGGALTGYAGGLWRKEWLLALEAGKHTEEDPLWSFI